MGQFSIVLIGKIFNDLNLQMRARVSDLLQHLLLERMLVGRDNQQGVFLTITRSRIKLWSITTRQSVQRHAERFTRGDVRISLMCGSATDFTKAGEALDILSL